MCACVQAPNDDDDSETFDFHSVLYSCTVLCPVPKHTMKKLDLSKRAMIDTANGKTGLAPAVRPAWHTSNDKDGDHGSLLSCTSSAMTGDGCVGNTSLATQRSVLGTHFSRPASRPIAMLALDMHTHGHGLYKCTYVCMCMCMCMYMSMRACDAMAAGDFG